MLRASAFRVESDCAVFALKEWFAHHLDRSPGWSTGDGWFGDATGGPLVVQAGSGRLVPMPPPAAFGSEHGEAERACEGAISHGAPAQGVKE